MSTIKYSKEHIWVKIETNTAIIGLTDFAQKEMGEIIFVSLKNINDFVKKGEPFGVIESVKTIQDVICPLSGRIIDKNKKLEENTEDINKDPCNLGWLIKIDIRIPLEIKELMDEYKYKNLLDLKI